MRKGMSEMLYVLATLIAMLAVTAVGMVVLYCRIQPAVEPAYVLPAEFATE